MFNLKRFELKAIQAVETSYLAQQRMARLKYSKNKQKIQKRTYHTQNQHRMLNGEKNGFEKAIGPLKGFFKSWHSFKNVSDSNTWTRTEEI